MAKIATPRKPGRPKVPGKKKSEIEQLQERAGREPARAKPPEAAGAASASPANGSPRAGGELGLEVPPQPVEGPAETKEEEEAAAAATAAKGKPGLTVNIA